jgi:hypothetical protein
VVSSAVKIVFELLPIETLRVDIVDELVVEFRKQEE